ncbi:MAG TPA: HAD family hydrolase [Candidatus Sulfotelmatobacter sp.]|jgi:putative hydrolase of the HAD superfamily
MHKVKVIFFDVGNTLLFPNRTKILAPLACESRPTLEQWRALERKTKVEFDRGMQDGRVDHSFWQTFHALMLDEFNRKDPRRQDLLVELVRNTRSSANWDQILPATRETLDRIATRYRIAVISNSDGGIDKVLSRCGIADCFEAITDSGNVGFEKPRREIFDAALRALKAQPTESLYVGDLYSVDYLGATNAGMQAVLFDVAGAYQTRQEARVRSLQELERWLEQ